MSGPLKGHICRVSDLRTSTTDDELRAMLTQTIENHLSEEEKRGTKPAVAIVPDCYNDGNERVALVEFPRRLPQFLSTLKENPEGDWQIPMGDMMISLDRHFLGFTQLYVPNPATKVTADIIAITGLDGHAYGSWRGKGAFGKMWLRDFLSEDLPSCRTLIYGYNSKLLNAGFNAIMDYGRALMEDIKLIRNTEELRQRPLIFIAHSFGGIILAHCLVKANAARENEDPDLTALYNATYGMLFFAIPHRGLLVDDIQQILSQQNESPRSVLLDQIRDGSIHLREQLDAFINIIRDRKIVSFYEQQQTKSLEYDNEMMCWRRTGRLVTMLATDSALIQLPTSTEEKIPLDADHSAIVKFNARSNLGYKHAKAKLLQFEKNAPGVVRKRFRKFRGASSRLREADDWIRKKSYALERLQIERLSGAKLPMEQCYINLAITKQVPGTAEHQEMAEAMRSSTFSLLARQKVQAPEVSAHVDLAAIFNKGGSQDKQPRRVLIQGQAGVGKTTLSKKIVYDFTHGTDTALHKSWTPLFDRLLWVPLRNLKRKPATVHTYEDLFYQEYFSRGGHDEGRQHAVELMREVGETRGQRTLFLLDGLDEISYDLGNDNDMTLFLINLLNNQNVIITSRPNAHLPDSVAKLDVKLETVGFHPDQVKAYIKADSKTRERADTIFNFLKDHWLIESLLRIPIQLDAFCYIWDTFAPARLPDTMTSMYVAMVERLWKKDVLRLEKVPAAFSRWALPSEVRRNVETEMALLERMAFNGLHNAVIDFTPTHRNEIIKKFRLDLPIDETLGRLSFLRTSDLLSTVEDRNYHFLHLTFQEYFAARYFVRRWKDRKPLEYVSMGGHKNNDHVNAEQFLRAEKYNARYDILWRFVAGVLQAEYDEEQLCFFFNTIQNEPRDILGPVHQRLVMHCLAEVAMPSKENAKFVQLRQILEDHLRKWLVLECKIRPDSGMFSFPQLATEMEYPENIINTVVRGEQEYIKRLVLSSQRKRPRIPQVVLDYAFGDNIPEMLRYVAFEALQGHDPLPEPILHTLLLSLQNSDLDVAELAAEAFQCQSILTEPILQALDILLDSPKEKLRELAGISLCSKSHLPESTLQKLATSLGDPHTEPKVMVLARAADALADYQDDLPLPIINTLGDLLKIPDPDIQESACSALYQSRNIPVSMLQELAAILKHPNRQVQEAACRVLSNHSELPAAVLENIVTLFKYTNYGVQMQGLMALDNASNLIGFALEGMLTLLEDPNLPTEAGLQLVYLLGNHEAKFPASALAKLTPLLRPDSPVRSLAAATLSKQTALEETIQQALEVLLMDPDGDVQLQVASALNIHLVLPVPVLEGLVYIVPTLCARMGKYVYDSKSKLQKVISRQLNLQPLRMQPVLHSLEKLFEDPWQGRAAEALSLGTSVRLWILGTLREHSSLPESLLQKLITVPVSETCIAIDEEVSRVVNNQLTISESVLQTLFATPRSKLLQKLTVPKLAALSEERLCSFLYTLSNQSFTALYRALLSRSFDEHVVWCVEGSESRLFTPEREWEKIPFDQLRDKVEGAQQVLGHPLSQVVTDADALNKRVPECSLGRQKVLQLRPQQTQRRTRSQTQKEILTDEGCRKRLRRRSRLNGDTSGCKD